MAKKQSFGDKVAKAKASNRKMAKVVIAQKKASGAYGYKEAIIDVNNVQDFLAQNK